MSHFLKVLQRHQAEIERLLSEQDGKPIPYPVMRDNGLLKPFAVRLPIPLLAILDEMVKNGLWESKQEMVYDMIQSAISDFVESADQDTKEQFRDIQQKAWEAWEKKNKDKAEGIAIGTLFGITSKSSQKNKRRSK